MNSISRALLLFSALLAAPVTSTMGQSNPTGNYGGNRSMTATPGTADGMAGSEVKAGDNRADATQGSYAGSTSNARMPGGTGRTVVPGSNSSQASVAAGTVRMRTDTTIGGGK
jgi:hypothetical protein